MKYLAILKDSLREALDSKVLYCTLGLSCFVIIIMGSMSFRAMSAEEGMETITKMFPSVIDLDIPPVEYQVTDFQTLKESSNPWEGEYRFLLIAKEPEEAQVFRFIVYISSLQIPPEKQTAEDKAAIKRLDKLAEEARKMNREEGMRFVNERLAQEFSRVEASQMERHMEKQLSTFGFLKATQVKVKSSTRSEVRFEVEVTGKENTHLFWPHTLTLFFGAMPTGVQLPMGPIVYLIEDYLVGWIGAGITMLISTIITAFFIPNMLRKGSVDLLLAKPIRRSSLLIYKYIGGLTFMFLNTAFVVIGIWLVIGLRSGLWTNGFLFTIFVLTFQFAIFYSVSALFGVLTRSPIVAILLTCFTWLLLFSVGHIHRYMDKRRPHDSSNSAAYVVMDTVHFILPRYKDLDSLTTRLLITDLFQPGSNERKEIEKQASSIKWDESLGMSGAFIALMLGLACWRFAKKDF